MIIEKEFVEQGIQNVVSYSGKDITPELIERCFKLDRVFYQQQFLWENTDIKNTILNNSQMCFIFVDRDQGNIVGYSYWFPIKEEIAQRFKEEKTILLDIKNEYCSGYKTSPIHLFLGGEAFVPGYDILNLHKAIEDIFQYHVLYLAKKGIKVETLSFDSVCQYDEQYLVSRTGLKNCVAKNNCSYYYDKYDPRVVYKDSKYCEELKIYYN